MQFAIALMRSSISLGNEPDSLWSQAPPWSKISIFGYSRCFLVSANSHVLCHLYKGEPCECSDRPQNPVRPTRADLFRHPAQLHCQIPATPHRAPHVALPANPPRDIYRSLHTPHQPATAGGNLHGVAKPLP